MFRPRQSISISPKIAPPPPSPHHFTKVRQYAKPTRPLSPTPRNSLPSPPPSPVGTHCLRAVYRRPVGGRQSVGWAAAGAGAGAAPGDREAWPYAGTGCPTAAGWAAPRSGTWPRSPAANSPRSAANTAHGSVRGGGVGVEGGGQRM